MVVHAHLTQESAVLPREEFDELVRLAGEQAPVQVLQLDEELPVEGLMRLAETGRAFDWLVDEPDLYTVADLKVRFR